MEPRKIIERISAFCQQTTIHPLSQLNQRNSPNKNAFWALISLLVFSICFYQVYNDVQSQRNNRYTINVRPVKGEEIVYPNYTVCYNHWALWVDFEQSVTVLNLTTHELLTLLAPFNNKFQANECPSQTTEQLLKSAATKMNLALYQNMPNLTEIVQKLKFMWWYHDSRTYFRTSRQVKSSDNTFLALCFETSVTVQKFLYNVVFPSVEMVKRLASAGSFSAEEVDRLVATLKATPVLYSAYLNERFLISAPFGEDPEMLIKVDVTYDTKCKTKLYKSRQLDIEGSGNVSFLTPRYRIWNGTSQFFIENLFVTDFSGYRHSCPRLSCGGDVKRKPDCPEIIDDTLANFFRDVTLLRNREFYLQCPQMHFFLVRLPGKAPARTLWRQTVQQNFPPLFPDRHVAGDGVRGLVALLAVGGQHWRHNGHLDRLEYRLADPHGVLLVCLVFWKRRG